MLTRVKEKKLGLILNIFMDCICKHVIISWELHESRDWQKSTLYLFKSSRKFALRNRLSFMIHLCPLCTNKSILNKKKESMKPWYSCNAMMITGKQARGGDLGNCSAQLIASWGCLCLYIQARQLSCPALS